MKEVLFFCYGDSSKAITWSNVPYLFSKTLEDKGVIVHRIDVSPNRILASLYSRVIYRIQKKFTNNTCSFRFSNFVSKQTYRKIRKSLEKFPQTDTCIFTSYDYYNKFNKAKTLLLGDWLFQVALERENRKPTKKELRFIEQQSEAIRKADCVIPLFPKCAERIQKDFPEANVQYLGGYVINSFYNGNLSSEKIIKSKIASKSILFVGTKKYIQAALKLIDAVKILQKENPSIAMNIIGMTKDDLDCNFPLNTKCYGYLKKDVPQDCEQYYKIVLDTSVIVNADPQWGGFSSIVEAMYFYTPIVVAPYADFVREFGSEISYGLYNTEFTPECIADNIQRILKSEKYNEFCLNAHERVKSFTWSSFVDKLITKI